MNIISRDEAKSHGLKYYYTGVPCKNGHLCNRYVSCTKCFECNSVNNSRLNIKYSKKIWVKNNQQKRTQSSLKHQRKMCLDPKYRLGKNVSRNISYCLNGFKNRRRWESFVGFTREELVAHLEKQFTDEMTWGNYGELWSLDHIKPVVACETFNEAWALSNLRPLLAIENSRKGSLYLGKRYRHESRREE